MSELRLGFHLSPLYAGTNGMKCEQCRETTYSVWLTESDCQWLPPGKNQASLVICERKLGRVWCMPCAAAQGRIAEYETVADTRIAELVERVEKLEHSIAFKQQWWGERFERLKELAKSNGTWPEVAAIIANGTINSMEPPTYAQLLNSAKHEAERLAAENAKLRELLSREHAEAICIKCGLRQPGENKDAGF